MSNQLVIETQDGWMIRCRCRTEGWHEFPKKKLANGASWTFNGDLFKPTFKPSMNECLNPPGPDHRPEHPTTRCHFTVTDGVIDYHGDCTHALRGKHPMEPWPEDRVRYYEALLADKK